MKILPLPRWRLAGQLLAVLASAFAAVTCDLVTAPEPGASSITVNYLGDTVLVVGDVVVLDASVTQGAVPIEGARLRLTSSDTNTIAVRDEAVGADSIIVKRRGTARIRATLLGSSLGDDPPFVEVEIRGVASAITIDDSTQVRFQNIDDTVTMEASAYRLNGTRIDSVSGIVWTSTHPTIVTVDDESGKITAQANTILPTRVFVRAQIDNVVDSIEVVVAQQLHSFAFTPGTLVMSSLNATATVTLTPRDSRGNAIPLNAPNQPTSTFTSLNTGVVTVTTINNRSFQVSSLANDTTRVRVVAGSLDTTYLVTVGQVSQTIIIQGTATPLMDALQDTLRVRARAFDATQTEVQGRAPIWTSLNTAVLTVDANGLITALSLGTALVTARMDASLDTISVTVQNLPASVRTSQAVLLPTVKDSVVLADTVLNKLGARLTGVPLAWNSLDPTIASVNPTTGLVVAEAIGTTRIIATLSNGAADTTLVQVQNRVASVAIVHPDTTFGSISDTATIRAEVRNARGALLPPSFATWSLTDSTVASVASGFVTALRSGFTFVILADPANPARVDSVRVIVTNAPEQVTLNRVVDTLTAPSRTLQYVADVRNARGAIILNPTVAFRSTNASVASVSASGLATAVAVGVTTIIAESGTGAGLRADTAVLRVTNDAVALTVSPTDVTIASVGATTALAADARNAVGGSVTGVTFTWSSSDNNVATVSPAGVVTGVAVGNAVITAQLAGLSATADITVTNAPDTINIGPTQFTMASINDSIAPPTTLVNALGAPLPRTSAQWLSDDGAIAAVTSNGIVIAVGRGTTKIRARNALNIARQDSVTVTVTNAPDSINVEQTLDSLPSLNRTLQYTAAVFNARRQLITGEPVTWTSRNGSIATVSATTGLASSVGIGATDIVGTAGTVSDSARLVVSNFAATVQLTPAAISLPAVAATTLLTAVARNELGNIIVNPAATWVSANPAVATVSTAGPAAAVTVTAIAIGSTTISATVDGVVQTVAVSVANSPTTVSFTSGNVTLASIGDQASPAITITNSLGAALPRSAVLWTTTDPNIFTVSSSGLVTAIGAGAGTLRATSPDNGTITSAITVTVTNAPATVTVAPAGTTTLTAIGQTATLTATVRNAAGAIINNPTVTWSTVGGAVSVGASSGVVTANANTAGQTVTATSGTATGNATVAVGQVASAATSTITASASSITANGVAASTITVRLKDALGVNLPSSGGTVSMTLTGTGSLSGVTPVGNGTYTATLTAPTALGSGAVSASINGASITTGDPMVTYVAGAASKFIVTTSTATPVAGQPVTITAQQADAFNNPVTTAANVAWSSTGGGSFPPGTTPTNGSGIATVSFTTSTVSGTAHTIQATAGVSGTSPVITTIPGAASKYLVSVSSPNPAASSAVTVTAQLADLNNNPVLVGGRTVNWSKTGAGGNFGAAQSTTDNAGVATVSFTVGTTSGTVHTAIATDNAAPAINGTSSSFTVGAGALNNFLVTAVGGGAIGTQAAGTPFNVQITARDIDGNTVGYTGTVLISSTGTLSGGTFTSGSFVAGVLASQPITLTNTGSFTISATKAVTGESGMSASFTTNAGALDHFLVEAAGGGPIATQAATTPFNIRITAQDQFNNTRTQFTGTTAVLTSTGTLSGAPLTTGNFTNGVLASQAVTMTTAGAGLTITATALGESGTSNAFTVGGGTATKYLVTSSDVAPQAGSSVLITAQLADAGNNAVFQSGQSVNWSKTGTGGSFATPFSVTNAQGVATVLFTVHTSSNTTHTVTATDNTALTGTSANIVTGAGAPTNLIFSIQPTSPEIVNQTMNTITVTARDNNNNTSTGFNGNVTLSITSGTGTVGAVLGGTVTVAAVQGVATFSNINIDRAGTNYRLTATIAGPITVNSNQFNVNNPAPTLTALNPATADRLQTLDVVFTGTGFLSGVTTLTMGAGITLNNLTVNSSTQLTANITITSTAATGSRNFTVTNPAPGGGTSGTQAFNINNPAPTLTSLGTTTGNRLQTLNVVFNGTGFITGVSSVNVDAGIQLNTTTVNSSTQITANITILATAATGNHLFSVTNTAPGGGTSATQNFDVSNPAPTLTAANPNSAVQGQTSLDVQLTGTNFISGVSTVAFSNAGITVNNTTVNSNTLITANITVAAGATPGAGTVSVTNAAPGGGTSATQAFAVNAPATPTLTNLSPNTGNRLQTLDVIFTGTGFVNGVTTVNLPAGFTLNTTTINSATSLTANITVTDAAPTGANSFSVTNTPAGGTSGNQTFTVSNPSPTLTAALSPDNAGLGQTLDVTFTGTGFITGVTTTINVGADITVNTITVNSATSLVANITIGATAVTGARNFSVTNAGPGGGTSGNRTFTINNPVPTVTNASPNTGVRGQTGLAVVLTGTGFIAGISSVGFENGAITVNNTTVNSPTQITVTISIGSGAATGAGDITVTNGAPGGGTGTLTDGFTVNDPATPGLTALNPAAGDRLQTLDVVFTGTDFVSGVSSVQVGAGITLNNTTVNSPTQITANITITAAAATGTRQFTVTNNPGGLVSATQDFQVNNPAPTATVANPSVGVQGQINLDVVITGTNFITGVTSVTFENPDITVNNVTVTSTSSLTANISINATAATGTGDITVTNAVPGGGSATITNGFDVIAPATPTLASISPNVGNRLQTLDVVFTGTGFVNGVTGVNTPAGFTVNTVTINSSTQLTANITVLAAAATGANNFSVTNNPGGLNSVNRTFTVSNPAPTLTNVTPTTVDPGTTFDLTLTGTGFIQGVSSVVISGNQVNNIVVTVNSPTQITATVTLGGGASAGSRTVRVDNAGPGGGSSANVNITVNP